MRPSETAPNAGAGGWVDPEALPPPEAASPIEDRTFAPPGADQAREALLEFLEVELHAPAMSAQPHPLSEEHRHRLLTAQEAIRAEMTRLRTCASAEEIVATLLERLDGGALDQLEEDARFLGFRAIADLADDLIEKARSAGVSCPEPRGEGTAGPGQVAPGRKALPRARAAERRQDRLLDEGIEETFPASDPVSVPRVDD